jgi:biopolymer transport protein ExbB
MQVWDFFVQGGPIMYILLILNIIGVAIIIAKIYIMHRSKIKIDDIATSLANNIKKSIKGVTNAQVVIETCSQEILVFMSSLQTGINAVKMIASISPLLGLLGTVIGVLMAFQQISQSGMGDPSSFAGGISMALITTVGGLIVAIPHYVAHSYFLGVLDDIEGGLNKKVLSKVIGS